MLIRHDEPHQVCATALGVPFSHTAHGWRYLFMLGAVPSILQFVGCFWIVESPQWLVSKGRVEDAKAALADLRSGDSDVDTELELLQKETTVVCAVKKVTMSRFSSAFMFIHLYCGTACPTVSSSKIPSYSLIFYSSPGE